MTVANSTYVENAYWNVVSEKYGDILYVLKSIGGMQIYNISNKE